MKLTKYKKLGTTKFRFRMIMFWLPFMFIGIIINIFEKHMIGLGIYIIGALGLVISSLILTKYDIDEAEEKYKI